MAIIEAVLAVVGLGFLILVVCVPSPKKPPTDDLAAPYREGLHAAVRMQRVAQDLEQQIYAEAARHLDVDAEPTGQAREQP